MHLVVAVALTFVSLILPLRIEAQNREPAPATGGLLLVDTPDHVAPQLSAAAAFSYPALYGPRAIELERLERAATSSLSRHLKVGGGIGAAAGAALGLLVISMADCSGSNCTTQRVVGVAGNAVGGAAIGALIGGAVYLIRR